MAGDKWSLAFRETALNCIDLNNNNNKWIDNSSNEE